MANMLYVTNIYEDENDGIWNKIKYNILAYQRLGFSVDFAYRKLNGHYVIEYAYGSSDKEIKTIDCCYKDLYFYSLSKIINEKYDMVYIRKPIGGVSFLFLIFLFNKVKKNKDCRIVLEIPTYPYVKEIKSLNLRVSEWILKLGRFSFIRYIDLITYMGDKSDKIWGRPSLRLANAIDLEHVNLVREELKPLIQDITFVGVARLSFWHGYDRLIKAISGYAGEYNISFLIVGNGEPEMSRLKKLVEDNGVEDKIIFLGSKSGNDLDFLYKQSHICVDSLGRHRSGSLNNSSLKSKEYTAKGLPFIKSHIDDSFLDVEFVFDITPDEMDINIEEIIRWYTSLPNETPNKMRRYAGKNLSWDNQCSKVIFTLFNLEKMK
ncbi:glycosyltransferase [Raoultella ornithinolytica]|uniref:glycosyltransferase n=1 Tax=Klebsiella/Raoultella group TaxID=2890311 RepID=UPI000E09A77C|nr:glycosyltransferase [Klebsiella pneumoniae]RDE41517.1 glycosyltransferase family 1 protein [Klebsiella pneumoniae]